MTSGQHIDYDALALEALRGVVKTCLAQVARTGLMGEHHFYIAFNTQAPGVGMSKRLKEKYPVEMTIVLQHRFWDLLVDDERFEVKLTFDGIPERLVVPFAAVKVFYDPSVPYVLQFEEIDPPAGTGTPPRPPRRIGGANGLVGARESDSSDRHAERRDKPERKRPSRKPRMEPVADAPASRDKPAPVPATVDHQSEGLQQPAPPAAAPTPPADGKPAVVAVGKADDETGEESDSSKKEEASEGAGGAKIFDISKFRGKK